MRLADLLLWVALVDADKSCRELGIAAGDLENGTVKQSVTAAW